MSNTFVNKEDWVVTLQARLAESNKWKAICRVEYTDTKILHNPYLTDPTVQSLTRGSAYTPQDITITDENITIDTGKILPQVIDRADLAQNGYVRQMELADQQGVLLNEAIETAMFADHASLTDFGDTGSGFGLTSLPISLSQTNIDDVIRGVKTQIRKANGEGLLDRNGGYMVWTPEAFELVEAFAQANGFNSADYYLKNGTNQGFSYMGMTHYSSNKMVSGHISAGVKGLYHLGICKSTYGQIVVVDEPAAAGGGAISGIGIISRVDFKFKAWFKVKPVLFDVNVNA